MPARKSRTARPAVSRGRARPVAELLPALLENALDRQDDLIVTCETDEDSGKKTLHIISGRFVTPCMLRKLQGQAESQKDEGAVMVSRKWK